MGFKILFLDNFEVADFAIKIVFSYPHCQRTFSVWHCIVALAEHAAATTKVAERSLADRLITVNATGSIHWCR